MSEISDKVEMLYDRILVRPDKAEDKVGSIFVPDSAKEKPQRGTVLAVGTGRFENGIHIPMKVKPFDTVLFGKYSGTDIELDGQEYSIMRESDVFMILK